MVSSMEKNFVLNKAQEIINEQFDKILKISIGNNTYRIAIRKDQIPKIKDLGIYDNIFIISFSDLKPSLEFDDDFYLQDNDEGKIETIFIRNVDKLNNESYRIKLNRKLIDFVKQLPETDKIQILQKHMNKRIAHSISEIIKTMPNTRLPQWGADV